MPRTPRVTSVARADRCARCVALTRHWVFALLYAPHAVLYAAPWLRHRVWIAVAPSAPAWVELMVARFTAINAHLRCRSRTYRTYCAFAFYLYTRTSSFSLAPFGYVLVRCRRGARLDTRVRMLRTRSGLRSLRLHLVRRLRWFAVYRSHLRSRTAARFAVRTLVFSRVPAACSRTLPLFAVLVGFCAYAFLRCLRHPHCLTLVAVFTAHIVRAGWMLLSLILVYCCRSRPRSAHAGSRGLRLPAHKLRSARGSRVLWDAFTAFG